MKTLQKLSSLKEQESLRKKYLFQLNNLDPNKIVYSSGFIFKRKKYSAKDMINEMENETDFSNQILLNIHRNLVSEIR